MPFHEWLSPLLDAWIAWTPFDALARDKVWVYVARNAAAVVGMAVGVALIVSGAILTLRR